MPLKKPGQHSHLHYAQLAQVLRASSAVSSAVVVVYWLECMTEPDPA